MFGFGLNAVTSTLMDKVVNLKYTISGESFTLLRETISVASKQNIERAINKTNMYDIELVFPEFDFITLTIKKFPVEGVENLPDSFNLSDKITNFIKPNYTVRKLGSINPKPVIVTDDGIHTVLNGSFSYKIDNTLSFSPVVNVKVGNETIKLNDDLNSFENKIFWSGR